MPSEAKITTKGSNSQCIIYNKKVEFQRWSSTFFCLFSAEDSALRRLIKREFPQAEVAADAGMHTPDNV